MNADQERSYTAALDLLRARVLDDKAAFNAVLETYTHDAERPERALKLLTICLAHEAAGAIERMASDDDDIALAVIERAIQTHQLESIYREATP